MSPENAQIEPKIKQRSERYLHLTTAILILTSITGGIIASMSSTFIESLGLAGRTIGAILGGLSGFLASRKKE
jgi:hypothetical protein